MVVTAREKKISSMLLLHPALPDILSIVANLVQIKTLLGVSADWKPFLEENQPLQLLLPQHLHPPLHLPPSFSLLR